MTDVLTRKQRSFNMSRIRGKDTKPEYFVRRLVHKAGYRYLLHDGRLPGKPDLVFKNKRKIILVHGCFWHLHNCRYGRVVVKTNKSFWRKKRGENANRDIVTVRNLRKLGWSVLVVWECWVKKPSWLQNKVIAFLEN
jgi:DNA mismatch endonuclease (patch repair protein)